MQYTETDPTEFDDILERVLDWEGHDIITEDVNDAGGLTRWGITHLTLAAWKKVPAKEISLSNMKELTRAEASEIYSINYFEEAGCQNFSFPVALCVFDTAVNLGPPKTIRLLQALVKVTQDGDVGPKTIKAVNAADEDELLLNLMGKRLQYYTSRPSYNHHGFGWFRRVLDIHAQAMAYTEGGENGD